MKVLITGGSGLLGTEIKIENSLKPTREQLDLRDYCALKRYIQLNKIEKIIHCGALVGGIQANKNKLYDFFAENMAMNLNILNACNEFSLQGSIFILSTCIYPENAKLPYNVLNLHDGEPHPSNYGYAYSKRMLEVGARSLWDQYGIATTCLIPCNLYGPNDNYNITDGHVIPSLIHKCYLAKQNNQDFVVWGSGAPQREFMYVKDFAKIIKMIHEGTISSVPALINVSPDDEYSIKKIAETIAQKINFSGNIVFDSNKPDGIFKKPSDSSVLKSILVNFKFTTLEEGISETIEHFINRYPNIRL